jgi:hypothetical protein
MSEVSMTSNRREFIEHLGATAMLSAIPLTALTPFARESASGVSSAPAEEWDFKWVAALKGKKHKAIMDCTEVENGYGVWRASMWAGHFQSALGANASDIATVLVIRHNAVVLGFKQEMWDVAGIGAAQKVSHPVTLQSTDRNPALLTAARNEVPPMFDAFALPNFINRGGIVLACNVALDFFSSAYAQQAKITNEEAKKRALAALLPGVVVMPSGVFACVKAQEEGCHYVRAS